MKTAKDFLFHVGEEDESVFATITAKEYWNQHRRVDDSEENDEVITQYGLDVLMEGMFEPREPMDTKQLRDKLLADGFEEDPAFTAFLKEVEENE